MASLAINKSSWEITCFGLFLEWNKNSCRKIAAEQGNFYCSVPFFFGPLYCFFLITPLICISIYFIFRSSQLVFFVFGNLHITNGRIETI
jgi:hypothetical protein